MSIMTQQLRTELTHIANTPAEACESVRELARVSAAWKYECSAGCGTALESDGYCFNHDPQWEDDCSGDPRWFQAMNRA